MTAWTTATMRPPNRIPLRHIIFPKRVQHVHTKCSICHINIAASRNNINSNYQHPQIRRCYGSKTRVELEKQSLPGMQYIQPYIRSCLSTDPESNQGGMDMEFAISFLGTGSGAPSMHRNSSCTALRLGGQTFLFDASEGTMRQLQFSRVMPTTITKIFISHLHGDHLFGLVPVILGLTVGHKSYMANEQTKRKHRLDHGENPKLEIYGPPGLYNYINMVLTLSCSKVNYLNIDVIELVGGKHERGPTSSWARTRGRRNIFLSHYPEIETPLVTRQYLSKVSLHSSWCVELCIAMKM